MIPVNPFFFPQAFIITAILVFLAHNDFKRCQVYNLKTEKMSFSPK